MTRYGVDDLFATHNLGHVALVGPIWPSAVEVPLCLNGRPVAGVAGFVAHPGVL